MGKQLWRKHSQIRVEKEEPGCVWTVFRLMNYHPWHNVKKMLPYINHKPNKVTNEQIEFCNARELEEDAMTNYSASVNSSPSRNGSRSRKRSIKARIKALLADKANKSGKVNTIEEHELLALKEACNDIGAPTLISLLKSNPTLLSNLDTKNESTNLNRVTSIKRKDSKDSKEDYVGVLELFRVDQEMFIKIVQDSPPKKHRLVKSGSFPFSNYPSQHSSTFGRTPSKLEHKHNDIWPVPTQGHELRKAKSHNIVRSSSLMESLDKYGHLIDTTSGNNKVIMNKHLSKSLKLTNEMDFGPLGDQHGRKSFRERMYLPEVESEAPRASLDSFLNNMSQVDQVRVLRLDSPPTEMINELNTDVKVVSSFVVDVNESIQQVEIVELMEDHNCELDVDFLQDQIEYVDWPILDSPTVSHRSSTNEIRDDVQGPETRSILLEKYEMERSNENFQYVKYVLDIIGFTTRIEQLEAWHSPDQPLDPALFDGIEICCPFEPKPSSKNDMTLSSSSRKILFDLINEAVFEIHENTYAYHPKALTFGCVVHPEPKGKSRVVEQVWEFVREWLRWKPEIDVELNMAMGHELSRHKNGWSNLQTDTELLGIDLEDWIFSDLLDEIVSS